MPAQFLIERRHDYYSYVFISDDDCILFFSRLYTSLSDCKRGIKALCTQILFPRQIEKLQTDGSYSFCVRDRKGELLGHSIVFFAGSSLDFAIRKIAQQSAHARIRESEMVS